MFCFLDDYGRENFRDRRGRDYDRHQTRDRRRERDKSPDKGKVLTINSIFFFMFTSFLCVVLI